MRVATSQLAVAVRHQSRRVSDICLAKPGYDCLRDRQLHALKRLKTVEASGEFWRQVCSLGPVLCCYGDHSDFDFSFLLSQGCSALTATR